MYSSTVPSWNTTGKFAVGTTSFVELTSLSKVTQTISLNSGWNIISFKVIPDNLDMKAIIQSLIDAGKLKKVMDQSGKAIEDFGAFGGWKNNIGNLSETKGYKVNVTAACTLNIEGSPVPLPIDIQLAAGWNIISYPVGTSQDALALFQSIINSGKLKKVMDESGKAIEDFGAFGGWKNNIGNLLPGKGYKVNVNAALTLNVKENANKSAVIVPEHLASSHFVKCYQGNGTDHFNINLLELSKSGLQEGDEFGVFDGPLCVGSARIGIDQLLNNQISLAASAGDELQKSANGFTSGNPVVLKLYRNNQEYILTPELLNNSKSLFGKGESIFAQVSFETLKLLGETDKEIVVRCYPNPFSDQVTIEINLPESEELQVRIYDNSGRIVRSLYNGQAEGKLLLFWNGRSGEGVRMTNGNYFVKANHLVDKILLR